MKHCVDALYPAAFMCARPICLLKKFFQKIFSEKLKICTILEIDARSSNQNRLRRAEIFLLACLYEYFARKCTALGGGRPSDIRREILGKFFEQKKGETLAFSRKLCYNSNNHKTKITRKEKRSSACSFIVSQCREKVKSTLGSTTQLQSNAPTTGQPS